MDAMGDSNPVPWKPEIVDELHELEARCNAMLKDTDKREFARVLLRLHGILHGLTTNAVLKDINDTLFYQTARFWFLLLDRIDMRVQVNDLKDEIRMLRRSLEVHDLKLIASIHKTYLGVVVSRLDAIAEGGDFLFDAE